MKYPKDLPTPTERELEILNILWDRGSATVREVHDELAPAKPSQYTTTLKLIQIMSEKGFLTRIEKDRSHVYRPVIRRDRVREKLASSLMERAFGGSLHKLVVGALGAKRASRGRACGSAPVDRRIRERKEVTFEYWMNPAVIQRIAGSLLHFFWQGAVLAAGTSVLLRMMARRTAAARYLVSTVALILMFAAPLLTFMYYAETGHVTLRIFHYLARGSAQYVSQIFTASGSTSRDAAETSAWARWIVLLWSTGVVIFALRLADSWRLSVRLKRSAIATVPASIARIFERVHEQLARGKRIGLMLSKSIDTPVVVGWLRPIVLLPLSAMMGLSEEQLFAVFAHELAHVRRHDFLVNVLQGCVEAVLFFHPAVWWLSARIRSERENCCDDLAVRICGDRLIYAQALVELERTRSEAPALALAAAGSGLTLRIRRILGRETRVRDWQSAAAALSVVLVWMVAGMWQSSMLDASTIAPPALRPGAMAWTSPLSPSSIATGLQSVAAILTAQPATALQASAGSIQGTVVRWGSNDPISDVDVELSRLEGTPAHPLGPLVYPPGFFSPGAAVRQTYPNPMDVSHARTGNDGKFRFTNLPPGKYRLWAARAGSAYNSAEYGQRDPRGPGMNFTFAEGQVMSDVKFPMAANGAISGVVFDAEGVPAAHVRVMAFEATYNTGRRLFQLTEGTETDDHGAYRLFFLPPGKYTIAARPEDPRRRFAMLVSPLSASAAVSIETHAEAPILFRTLDGGTVIEETYTLVYHGGYTDPQKARLIDLAPGANVESIDISLRAGRMRAVHVRGVVTDSVTGKPAQGVSVRATPAVWSPSLITPSSSTDANGRFDIPGIGSGPYTLVANLRAAGVSQTAVTGIDASEKDIEGLALVLTSGSSISGHMIIEGIPPAGSPPDPSVMTIVLAPEQPNLPGAVAKINSGGGFTLTGVQPGTYRVFINPIFPNPGFPPYPEPPAIPAPIQGLYVKSIHLGVDDALNGSVRFENTQTRELAIVLDMDSGRIDGIVEDVRQQHESNAVVALVPSAPSLRNRTDLYQSAVTDEDGQFSIQGVAPGSYKLFSWDYAADGAWQDSEFLSSVESRSKTISVAPGKNPQVVVTTTGARP